MRFDTQFHSLSFSAFRSLLSQNESNPTYLYCSHFLFPVLAQEKKKRFFKKLASYTMQSEKIKFSVEKGITCMYMKHCLLFLLPLDSRSGHYREQGSRYSPQRDKFVDCQFASSGLCEGLPRSVIVGASLVSMPARALRPVCNKISIP